MVDLYRASRVAEQAAYAVGTHLQASRSRLAAAVVTREDPLAVVRAIDLEALAMIYDIVTRQFPEHGFHSERGGHDGPWPAPPGQPQWLVDPISGLSNYQRGYPQYAVSIALVEDGEPQLGVVYDPCRNEFFGAIRGRGAVLNGAPIHCSGGRPATDALAATVFPKPGSARMSTYVTEFGRVVRGLGGVRRSGSMALELAYLAASRIDAFWEYDMGCWDCAAGVALLRESGALVHARDARPLLHSQALLACTPNLFEPFLSLLVEG